MSSKDPAEAWVAPYEKDALAEFTDPDKRRALNEALDTFSERNLFQGLAITDRELAIRIWAVVETARRNGFPDDMRM